MPNATAKRASEPSATRWLADEVDEVGTGVDVATAPTPLVTGPPWGI